MTLTIRHRCIHIHIHTHIQTQVLYISRERESERKGEEKRREERPEESFDLNFRGVRRSRRSGSMPIRGVKSKGNERDIHSNDS